MNEPSIACSANRAVKVLTEHKYDPGGWQPFGPAGFSINVNPPAMSRGSVIVTQSDFEAEEWLHASIAFQFDTPAYGDLVVLKAAVFGSKRYAYQVFAAEADHVNIHPNALHLWGRADGKPALPDFGEWGTI